MVAHGDANSTSGVDAFNTWTNAFGSLITSLALIVGGIWAYFKFAKGRTFRPRLEIEMSGQWLKIKREQWLQVRVRVSNIGAARIKLQQEGTGLEAWVLVSAQALPPDYATWQSKKVYEVLDDHRWVEPGETVSDDLLLNLGIRPAPVRLDARIIVKRKIFGNIEVNARQIVPAAAVIDHSQA